MNRPSRQATILIVDDDADDRALIEEALNASRPYTDVHHARNGEELLEYLESCRDGSGPSSRPHPDLILLDLNMPRMNGYEALEAVKAEPTMRQIPVVVLTTSTAQDDVDASYALGANSFVSKSSSYAVLAAHIATLASYWLVETAEPPSGGVPNMLLRHTDYGGEGTNGHCRRHELAVDRGGTRH